MSIFRVGFFPDFKWSDVVLVGADRDGMRVFQSALRSAHEEGQSSFELHGVQHRILRQDGTADLDFGWQTIAWRFDGAKLMELLEMVTGLSATDHPVHNYFDELHSPTETLM